MVVKALELGIDVVLITVAEQGPPGPGGGGGGGGGHTIQEDGTNLTARANLNFGAGILATDNPGSSRTDVTVTTGLIGAVDLANVGVAGGVASLDGSGKVPSAQLPTFTVTDVFVVASEAEMLALAATVGDYAIRTDTNQTFILADEPATVLGNWVELLTGGGVTSVNGQTGAVILDANDVGAVDSDDVGVSGGVASLDGSGKVPDGQIPNSIARDSEVSLAVSTSMNTHLADTDPHPQYVTTAEGNAAYWPLSTDLATQVELDLHVANGQHPASNITLNTATFDGLLNTSTTNVQFLAEIVDELGTPPPNITDGTYLLGTLHGGLPNAIVVGTTPQGELGGTWAAPTIDPVHSGSSHADVQAAAEATAASLVANHEAETIAVHGIADTSLLETQAGADAKIATHVADTTNAHVAQGVSLSTAGFVGILTAGDTDVQILANHIDTLTATDIFLDADGFTTNLSPSTTNVQLLAEAVDTLALATQAVFSVNTFTGDVVLGASDVGAIDATLLGQPNGVATLDGTGKLTLAEWPPLVTTVNGVTGEVDLTGELIPLTTTNFNKNLDSSVTDVQLLADAVDNLAIPTGAGLPNGLATLDGTGILELAQRPPAVTDINGHTGEVTLTGADIPLAAGGFSGNLDNTVTDVQLLAEAVDALTGGGGGGAPADATYLTTTSNASLSNEVVVGTTPGGELGGTWASPTVDATHSGSSHASVQAAAEATAAAALAAHTGATTGAHAATAISFSPTGSISSTTVQAAIAEVASEAASLDPTLTAFAALTTAADKGIYATGVDAFATYDLTSYARSLGAVTSAAGMKDAFEIPEYIEGLRLTSTPGPEDSLTIVFDVDLSEGKIGGDTLHGSSAATEGLIIGSTSHPTRGWIDLRDKSRLLTEDFSWDGGIGGAETLYALDIGGSKTITLTDGDGGIGNSFNGIMIHPTVVFTNDAFAFGAGQAFSVQSTRKNATGVNVSLGSHFPFFSAGSYVADGGSGGATVTIDAIQSFTDGVSLSTTGSTPGVLNVTAVSGIVSNTAIGSGVTVTNRYSLQIGDPFGSGTLTNNYGIVIDALTKGGTLNIGLLNNSKSYLVGGVWGSQSGGNLNIHDGIEQRPTDQTFTSTPTWFLINNTYTANFATASLGSLLSLVPTVLVPTSGNSGGTLSGITFAPTLKTVSGAAVPLGTVLGMVTGPVITADTATSVTATNVGFTATATYNVANSGTFNSAGVTNYNIATGGVVNTGAAVGSFTHVNIGDITGSGTVTTQIGVDIPALTKGGTNYGLRSLGTNIITTIYGSTASGGDLTLGATNHATTGTIFVLDEVEQRPTDATFGASQNWWLVNNTYTFDFLTASVGTFLNFVPTILLPKGGTSFGTVAGMVFAPTLKSTSGGTSTLGTVFGYNASPTVVADTVTGVTATVINALLAPSFSVANSGTFTSGGTTAINVSSVGTVNASAALGTFTHISIADVTGSGTLTTQYGLDIVSLAKATTNIGIRSLGTNVIANIHGSESSGGHLNLQSTTHATQGDIQLDNKTVELLVTNYTNTAATYYAMFADNTVTMNASGGTIASGNSYNAIRIAQTVVFQDDGNIGVPTGAFRDETTYKNTASSPQGLGLIYSVSAAPTMTADGAASSVNYAGMLVGPTYSLANSGTFSGTYIHNGFYSTGTMNTSGQTMSTWNNFAAAAPSLTGGTITALNNYQAGGVTISTSQTVTTWTGLQITWPTGAGTLTTGYGIDVPAASKGTTAVGIRTAAPIVFTPTTKTISAASDTFAVTSPFININTVSAGGITLTSNPTIPDTGASEGQLLIMCNTDSADTVTFTEGNNVKLNGGALALGPGDVVMFIYIGGLWRQVAPLSANAI